MILHLFVLQAELLEHMDDLVTLLTKFIVSNIYSKIHQAWIFWFFKFPFIVNTLKKTPPNTFENNGQECIFDIYKFHFKKKFY